MGQQLSWLEHTTDNREVDGSSPFWPTTSNMKNSEEALRDRAVEQKNKMARKAALDEMPVAYRNRRGFPAGKRVHFGPPLL